MTGHDRERVHERDTQDHAARERLIQDLLRENRELDQRVADLETAAAQWAEAKAADQMTPAREAAFDDAIRAFRRTERRQRRIERKAA